MDEIGFDRVAAEVDAATSVTPAPLGRPPLGLLSPPPLDAIGDVVEARLRQVLGEHAVSGEELRHEADRLRAELVRERGNFAALGDEMTKLWNGLKDRGVGRSGDHLVDVALAEIDRLRAERDELRAAAEGGEPV